MSKKNVSKTELTKAEVANKIMDVTVVTEPKTGLFGSVKRVVGNGVKSVKNNWKPLLIGAVGGAVITEGIRVIAKPKQVSDELNEQFYDDEDVTTDTENVSDAEEQQDA